MACEQESSQKAAGAIVVTALGPKSIPIPSLGVDWSWGRCSCHIDPCQTKFQSAWFLTSVAYGFRIEPAQEIGMFVLFCPHQRQPRA